MKNRFDWKKKTLEPQGLNFAGWKFIAFLVIMIHIPYCK